MRQTHQLLVQALAGLALFHAAAALADSSAQQALCAKVGADCISPPEQGKNRINAPQTSGSRAHQPRHRKIDPDTAAAIGAIGGVLLAQPDREEESRRVNPQDFVPVQNCDHPAARHMPGCR